MLLDDIWFIFYIIKGQSRALHLAILSHTNSLAPHPSILAQNSYLALHLVIKANTICMATHLDILAPKKILASHMAIQFRTNSLAPLPALLAYTTSLLHTWINYLISIVWLHTWPSELQKEQICLEALFGEGRGGGWVVSYLPQFKPVMPKCRIYPIRSTSRSRGGRGSTCGSSAPMNHSFCNSAGHTSS